ncbi:MAG TPA: YdeI/OmpD-associated family protein [Candidatus Dormibacteraeota bacterium]|jgi:hypothetical protein
MRFRTTIIQTGKTACGIRVPDAIVAGLGSSKRPAVRVTIKHYTYRSTVARMGGEFWIGVSAENRAAAGVKAADVLDVRLELDQEPRVLAVPLDLARALGRNAAAMAAFERLSYSNKQRHVLPIEAAKTGETRERRIARAVAELADRES